MISKRLSMILTLVQPCRVLADIGTDHGYLALEAILTNVAQHTIAADVRPGPLKQAQKTFAQANVFQCVEFVLSDGLRSIQDPIDCVVIGGMGADLILKIIMQDLERLKKTSQIIIQANTKLPLLRKSMDDLGFTIIDEKIVLDGFFYVAQHYIYNGHGDALDEFQINFGLYLDLKDPVYCSYLESEMDRINAILRSHPNSLKHKALINLLKTRLNERAN